MRNHTFSQNTLFIFTIVNPIFAQIGYIYFPTGFNGISLMQLVQGLYFIYITLFIFKNVDFRDTLSEWIKLLLYLYVFSFALNSVRILIQTDSEFVLQQYDWYLKIVFALTLWYFVTQTIHRKEDAYRFLACVVWSCVATVVFIFYFYITTGGNVATYARAGVSASFGAEGISGKAMAGFLVQGTFISLYLWIDRYMKYGLLWSMLIMVGTILTFDRAAQVSLVIGILGLLVWFIRGAHLYNTKVKLFYFYASFTCLIAGLIYIYGVDYFLLRWQHDLGHGSLGSGRSELYAKSVQWYWYHSSITETLFGIGYHGILTLMQSIIGRALHTHSDYLDMMLAGGVFGVALYIMLFITALRCFRFTPKWSLQRGMLIPVILAFTAMSLTTGLFHATQAMFIFGGSNICLAKLSLNNDT